MEPATGDNATKFGELAVRCGFFGVIHSPLMNKTG